MSIALTAALLVAAVLAVGLVAEIATLLRASAPRRIATLTIGSEPAGALPSIEIPRIVWTYWDVLPLPSLIADCLGNWRRHAPDHEIRLVDRASAARWLGASIDVAAFDALPAYRQADWLRLQLLIRHGGVWMDGSTLLTTGLDWVHRLAETERAGVVGFYIDRYTTDPRRPIVENWFIASTPRDPFIVAWAAELDRALAMGEARYVDALRAEGGLDAVAQGIPATMQAYLVMHLAASRVLSRASAPGRLALQRAEDVAFAFHAALRWRKRHLYARLALTPAPCRVPALIKLRSGDRAVAEAGLARGRLWRGSLLARLLDRRP